MAETQLDRIENMLKAILGATTTVNLKGTDEDRIELRTHLETNISVKKEITP